MFNTIIIIYYKLWRSWNHDYGLWLPLLVFVYGVPKSWGKKIEKLKVGSRKMSMKKKCYLKMFMLTALVIHNNNYLKYELYKM